MLSTGSRLIKYPSSSRIEHIHHAGNSSAIVDGAAGQVLVASKAWARPMARNPAPASVQPPARHRPHDQCSHTGLRPTVTYERNPRAGRHDHEGHRPFRGERGLLLPSSCASCRHDVDHERLKVNGAPSPWAIRLARRARSSLGRCSTRMERKPPRDRPRHALPGPGMGAATIIERVVRPRPDPDRISVWRQTADIASPHPGTPRAAR